MSKNLKKIFSLMLALCLAFGMTTVAFAGGGEPEETDTEIIVDAIVSGLNGYTLEQKNEYVSDLIDSLAVAVKDLFPAEDIAAVAAILKGLEIGEEDWANVNAIIEAVLPAVLDWADEDDVAAIAGMVKEGKDSNEVLEFVLPLLITDKAVAAVFTSLKDDGLLKSVEALIALLDNAGILEQIYEAYSKLEDALEFDSYVDAKAALIEELGYLASEKKFGKYVDAIDTWLETAIDDEYKVEDIIDFINAFFANEPSNAQRIAYAVIAKLNAYDNADKNLYVQDVLANIANFVKENMKNDEGDSTDKETVISVIALLQGADIDDEFWASLNVMIENYLPAIIEWTADEDQIAEALEGIEDAELIDLLSLLLNEEKITNFLSFLKAKGVKDTVAEILDRIGADEAFADNINDFLGNADDFLAGVDAWLEIAIDDEYKVEDIVGFIQEFLANTPKEYLLGDMDNDGIISAADARLALRASVGLEIFSAYKDTRKFWAADVDGSNRITARDARTILRVSVGLEEFGEVLSYETKVQMNAVIDSVIKGLDALPSEDREQYIIGIIDSITFPFEGYFGEDALSALEAFVEGLDIDEDGWDDYSSIILDIILPFILILASSNSAGPAV